MAAKAYILIEVDVGKAAEVVGGAQKLDYNTYRDEILRNRLQLQMPASIYLEEIDGSNGQASTTGSEQR